jgi:4-diphosphocytidyl-2-C-methyl-D-erythritol kinase
VGKGRWLVLRAYAKLNLCLEVLGRRHDGYHELASVFLPVSLYDTVVVEVVGEWGGVEVEAVGWPTPRGPANLCWRAAHRWRQWWAERAGAAPGVRVRLTKRLPPGGGLGGGSSNAAAVLAGLNAWAAAASSPAQLMPLASPLGSDVPFFLGSGAALVRGRGERLDPLPPAPSLPLVVAWPGAGVATAWAYHQLQAQDFSSGQQAQRLAEAWQRGEDLSAQPGLGYNAFLAPLTARRPDIAALLGRLQALRAKVVSLAGSGACVWGLFADQAQSEDAAQRLRAQGIWAHAVHPVGAGVEIIDCGGASGWRR